MERIQIRLSFRQKIVQFFLSAISLFLAIHIVDVVEVDGIITVLLAVLFIQLFQYLLQPLFGLLVKILGIFGLLITGFFAYGIIVWLTITDLSNITVESFWGSLATAWVYALFITIIDWIYLSRSDDVYIVSAIKNKKIKAKKSDKVGFIFVQLDGVSAPVLDWQLKAGNLPNIARLINEQDYTVKTWHTQIPSTTPASQAGILFGNNQNIPAFRWYDREEKELIVANQPKGASIIEKRCSNGNGLLADDGVSVGNLFSGDAKTNIMVMSKVEGDRASIKNMREYRSYFYTPIGFMRSFILSIGEMVKEIYQARRQETHDIKPRIKRHGSYIILRAITNVMLRDLQTVIVIQNMMKGVNSLYVDYLDYDEVAHHAGVARAESLASLSGIDRVIGILDRAKKYAPRPYELILLSDHGQSQGPTFKQLHNGKNLEKLINDLTNATVSSEEEPAEQNTTKFSFLNQLFSKKSKKSNNEDNKEEIVVTGSGNLGNIWFTSYNNPLTYDEINNIYPDIIDKLLSTKGIGYVFVNTKDGSLCISQTGSINLDTNNIIGINPLDSQPNYIKTALQKLRKMKARPDICVISSYNDITGEVYAFEELVGNHGGIGGWQTEAILMHPKHLKVQDKYLKDGEIVDSESVHKILKSWLK